MKGLIVVIVLLPFAFSSEENDESGDYCQFETFKPRCMKNEAILMKIATYGRMRIGRCITAEEVAEQGPLAEEDPRFLRCSADILPLMDRKCSGKKECEIRVYDISDENIKPCFAGLKMYLYATYSCINVADERRSCTVTVSGSPVYMASAQTLCGTKSQPWTVEAPAGKKVIVTLLEFPITSSDQIQGQIQQPCDSYGVVMEKTVKRNASICRGSTTREKTVYTSNGNTLELLFGPSDQQSDHQQFMIKVQAVGCSNIIPPEDAWLKRKDGAIIIGCYVSRQTWHLNCQDGNWVGVIGNCSQDHFQREVMFDIESKGTFPNTKQVLTMTAIVGFSLAICLSILCIGMICLRRFKLQRRKKQKYSTLTYNANPARIQQFYPRDHSTFSKNFVQDTMNCRWTSQPQPAYSVSVQQNDNDIS